MVRHIETLKRLVECMGIPGYEDEVRNVIKKELQPICDEITVDKIGNIIGTRRGRNDTPTLMLASHMDIPGFMTFRRMCLEFSNNLFSNVIFDGK